MNYGFDFKIEQLRIEVKEHFPELKKIVDNNNEIFVNSSDNVIDVELVDLIKNKYGKKIQPYNFFFAKAICYEIGRGFIIISKNKLILKNKKIPLVILAHEYYHIYLYDEVKQIVNSFNLSYNTPYKKQLRDDFSKLGNLYEDIKIHNIICTKHPDFSDIVYDLLQDSHKKLVEYGNNNNLLKMLNAYALTLSALKNLSNDSEIKTRFECYYEYISRNENYQEVRKLNVEVINNLTSLLHFYQSLL